jgi:hypothetical protein
MGENQRDRAEAGARWQKTEVLEAPENSTRPRPVRLRRARLVGFVIVESAIAGAAVFAWRMTDSAVAAYLILAQGLIGAIIWYFRARRCDSRALSFNSEHSR